MNKQGLTETNYNLWVLIKRAAFTFTLHDGHFLCTYILNISSLCPLATNIKPQHYLEFWAQSHLEIKALQVIKKKKKGRNCRFFFFFQSLGQ